LEAAGLLRRERSRHDERSLALVLTDRGQKLRAQAETIPSTIVEKLGMEVSELRALHHQLSRVIAAAVAVV
ncbi:MAG: transcriptional regulator, MarR family, partial [Marmoricola sp.]|nr:transcriptional regulator, MarR family [Marmoricola sp.]